uniref:Protein DPCD n=2 Tax=Timema TaxID=61471 RepID=A0A7R9ALS6_TIMSH|nr:unnamed protein product [Timema shepardi]CAD7572760.1 unnamed protein product [Timema californicum]
MAGENNWLDMLKKAEKVCLDKDGYRKVHYRFDGGNEMVEEYNLQTNVLTRRAWKRVQTIGGQGTWEVELGDPEPSTLTSTNLEIKESSITPFVTKRLTKSSIEWRIRNLPYPLAVYSVTADPENMSITVRTSNKKYFKVLPVPDLQRVGLQPAQKNISVTHQYNTLIITYIKPQQVLLLEKNVLDEVKKLKTAKDDGQCNPS